MKTMLGRILATITAAVALASAGGAAATVSVGGYDFEDNAFVDSLIGSNGTFTAAGKSTAIDNSFPGAITDADAATYVYSWGDGAFLDLGFTDNAAVNRDGVDLVIFELGGVDPIRITINGVTVERMAVFTGYTVESYYPAPWLTPMRFNINALAVDLSDFNVLNLGKVTSLRVETPWNSTVATPALVGALNSGSLVPEPGQWALMILGFGMVGTLMRRRRISAA